jgi:hypothetical protein
VISRYKTGKHFAVTITGITLAVERRQDQIDAEAAAQRQAFKLIGAAIPLTLK